MNFYKPYFSELSNTFLFSRISFILLYYIYKYGLADLNTTLLKSALACFNSFLKALDDLVKISGKLNVPGVIFGSHYVAKEVFDVP